MKLVVLNKKVCEKGLIALVVRDGKHEVWNLRVFLGKKNCLKGGMGFKEAHAYFMKCA